MSGCGNIVRCSCDIFNYMGILHVCIVSCVFRIGLPYYYYCYHYLFMMCVYISMYVYMYVCMYVIK